MTEKQAKAELIQKVGAVVSAAQAIDREQVIAALAKGDMVAALAGVLDHAGAVVAARDAAEREAFYAAQRASHRADMAENYGVRRSPLPAGFERFAAPQVIDPGIAAAEAAAASAAADTAEAAAALVESFGNSGVCAEAAIQAAQSSAQSARRSADRVAHLL
jgi:hypothetical protein